MIRHYMHLLAPLALWVIALALYIVTVTNDLPRKVDAVKVYQLQKKPHVFEDAWFNVRDAFSTYWPSDTCYTLTDLTGQTSCQTQRSNLVNSVLSNLECTKFPSQACNCVAQVTKGIYRTGNTTNAPYKALGGWRDSTQFAIESCRWLMHNAHAAVSTGKIYAQRTVLVLLITTMLTGNAFDWIVVNYFLRSGIDSMSKAAVKTFAFVFWGMLTFIIAVPVENNTYTLLLLIILPPILTLGLYEFYNLTYHIPEKPYIHPYAFCVILGALSLLAHMEMGVLDWDVLVYEIIKSNIASLIYLQVIWKYMIRIGKNDFSYSKFVEEGTLRSVILVFILYVAGLMAPYTDTSGVSTMVMWYTPLLWVVLAFASVTWVCSFKYNEYFGEKIERSEANVRPSWEITSASQYVSSLALLFTLLVLLYYLRENATVYLALVNNFPVDSIQYNSTLSWQRPPAIPVR